MPYGKNEIYLLNLELPACYVIAEVQKHIRIKPNEKHGMFEYYFAKGNLVSWKSLDNIQQQFNRGCDELPPACKLRCKN